MNLKVQAKNRMLILTYNENETTFKENIST